MSLCAAHPSDKFLHFARLVLVHWKLLRPERSVNTIFTVQPFQCKLSTLCVCVFVFVCMFLCVSMCVCAFTGVAVWFQHKDDGLRLFWNGPDMLSYVILHVFTHRLQDYTEALTSLEAISRTLSKNASFALHFNGLELQFQEPVMAPLHAWKHIHLWAVYVVHLCVRFNSSVELCPEVQVPL